MQPSSVSLPSAGITPGWALFISFPSAGSKCHLKSSRPHSWASPSGLRWFTSTWRASSADLVPQRTSLWRLSQVFTILWLKYSYLWRMQTFGHIMSLASMCMTQTCRGWADGPVLKVLALQVRGPKFNPGYLPEKRKKLGVEMCAHTPSAEGVKTGRAPGSWDSQPICLPCEFQAGERGTAYVSKSKAKSS